MLRRAWQWVMAEARAAVVARVDDLRFGWGESFRFMRKSILPALLERVVGIIAFGAVLALLWVFVALLAKLRHVGGGFVLPLVLAVVLGGGCAPFLRPACQCSCQCARPAPEPDPMAELDRRLEGKQQRDAAKVEFLKEGK